jgi:lysine-specific demethylase 8
MEHWPALSRWQRPGYLLGVAGQRTVPVEVGSHYLEEGWGQQLMPLSDFLGRHVLARAESSSCPAAEGA